MFLRTLTTRRFFPTLLCRAKSVNNVTLVGVVHDLQSGFVYEDPVTQFVVTTTSLDTTNPLQECVVEKDHHTIRCFGEAFSTDIKDRIREGNVVCVTGRLRLNPQLEPSCNKYFYFPYLHVAPPHGSIAVVHGDRRRPPPMAATASVPVADDATPAAATAAAATAAAATAAAATAAADAPSTAAETISEAAPTADVAPSKAVDAA